MDRVPTHDKAPSIPAAAIEAVEKARKGWKADRLQSEFDHSMGEAKKARNSRLSNHFLLSFSM